MNLHFDSPYNFKTASNPIVLPESITDKIKALIPKIKKTQEFLSEHPDREARTAGFFEISPEEDIYLNEGWIVRMIVTKKPPVGAPLDYREQEKTLYINQTWKPSYMGIYHEMVHALDPKARPGYEGYIQRDPDTYFTEEPGGYFKVPEEIDAIQSSYAHKVVEYGKYYHKQDEELTFDEYIEELRNWLQSPDTSKMPSAIRGGSGIYIWMKEPKLRKQFLKRMHWALQQLEQLEPLD